MGVSRIKARLLPLPGKITPLPKPSAGPSNCCTRIAAGRTRRPKRQMPPSNCALAVVRSSLRRFRVIAQRSSGPGTTIDGAGITSGPRRWAAMSPQDRRGSRLVDVVIVHLSIRRCPHSVETQPILIIPGLSTHGSIEDSLCPQVTLASIVTRRSLPRVPLHTHLAELEGVE